MKNKLLCGLLAITMALVPMGTIGVVAAEFTDGQEMAAEAKSAAVEDVGEADGFDDSEEVLFSDETGGEEVIPATMGSTRYINEYDPNYGDYFVDITASVVLSETEEFVRLINEERKKLGLRELYIDKELMEISQRRAVENIIYYDHASPSGVHSQRGFAEVLSPGSSLAAEEYKNSWKSTADWEKPISHWDILMDPDITRIGFAIAYQPESVDIWGQYIAYGVANLGGETIPGTWEIDTEAGSYVGGYKDKIETTKIGVSSEIINLTKDKKYSLEKSQKICIHPMFKQITLGSPQFYINSSCGSWESTNPSVATVDSTGTVTGITPGTADIHFYVNGDRDMYYSRTVVVTAPAPVVKAKPSKYQYVDLSWTKSSGADGYVIYKYKSKTKKYEKLKSINSAKTTSCTIKQGYAGTESYKVRPYSLDANGKKVYGTSSKAVKVKTAPYAPYLNNAEAKYKGSVSLKWEHYPVVEGYQVYRATSKNGTYTRIKTLSDTKKMTYTGSYKDTKVKKGKTYYYKVRGYRVNADGSKVYSKFSRIVSGKVK